MRRVLLGFVDGSIGRTIHDMRHFIVLERQNFVKKMIELGRQSSDIRVVSDQIGSPTYAADLARAIACILKSPQWVQGIYQGVI